MSLSTNPADPDALLKELASEGAAPAPDPTLVADSTLAMRQRVVAQAAGGWQSAKDGVKRLRYTHEDCIDLILARPGISQNELAEIYGVTPAWMSIVVNCDAFKVKLAERKAELVDPVLQASLNERYGALAAASVDRLLKRIADEKAEVTDKVLLEAAALGAKAIGMGEPKPTGPSNAVDHLAALAHRLVDLNRPAPPAAEVVDVPSRSL